jgi:hypothetical protein
VRSVIGLDVVRLLYGGGPDALLDARRDRVDERRVLLEDVDPRAVRPGGQVGLLGLPALGLDLQDFALILLFGWFEMGVSPPMA